MNDKINCRMCIMCRNMLDKDLLVRIAKVDNNIIVDKTKKSGGRGAYLCSSECLQKAYKTGRIAKSLRHMVTDEFIAELKGVFENEK